MYPPSSDAFGDSSLEDGLLVVETPSAPDLDMLADAFVTFAETHFDPSIDGHQTEVFSWAEVKPDQFEGVCLAQMTGQTSEFLQAVWTPGRLGIIAKPQRLTEAEWEVLISDLVTSQDDITAPSDRWTANVQTPTSLPKADRRQPIHATPAQLSFLHLSALQEDDVHPTVSMPPIYLTSANVPALEATFEALQERHEVLHMSFAEVEGEVFLRLNDEEPLPFSAKRTYGSLQKIEDLAKRAEATLAASLSQNGPLWKAVLVQKGTKSAVICVLSETIADPQTAQILHDEVSELYEWFQNNGGPEPSRDSATVQFLETAVAQPDKASALAWWDKLPLGRKASQAITVAEVAPVVVWDHALPAALCARLETSTQNAQAVIFHTFLRVLAGHDGAVPTWALARAYDLRPASAPKVMGQFTMDVPIWLGGLADDSTVKESADRLTSTLHHGLVSMDNLRQTYPSNLPDRIPHLFDWRTFKPSPNQLALPQDVTLRAWPEGDVIKTQWAIRRDHPLSLKERKLLASFERELIKAVDLSEATI